VPGVALDALRQLATQARQPSPRLDAGCVPGRAAHSLVAAVEDPAVAEDDRLEQAVLADVADELAERVALDLQRFGRGCYRRSRGISRTGRVAG
jgi:hypothetical protein